MRSTRIFKGAGAGVVRLTIDEGAVMREHTATTPILLQVLSGHAALDVGGERVDLPAGAILHLDANLPHSVKALTRVHLLLIVCERAPATRPHRLDSPATVDASVAASTPKPARRSNLVLASSGALLKAEQEPIDPAISRIDAALADRLRTERELVTGAIGRLANLSGHVEVAGVAVELRMHLGQHLRFFADHALPVLARTGGLTLASLWSDIEALMVDGGAPAFKSALP